MYKFLRSQGFVSSYDTAHRYTDSESQKVIVFLHLENTFGYAVDFW